VEQLEGGFDLKRSFAALDPLHSGAAQVGVLGKLQLAEAAGAPFPLDQGAELFAGEDLLSAH
jgi:hypothetical protein